MMVWGFGLYNGSKYVWVVVDFFLIKSCGWNLIVGFGGDGFSSGGCGFGGGNSGSMMVYLG